MAIPTKEKNKKLKATLSGGPMAAEIALKKLKRKGKSLLIFSSDEGPRIPTGGLRAHIQGMTLSLSRANKRRHMYVTTNAKKGKIITDGHSRWTALQSRT